MIRSMTGYGRAEKIIDGREITVELRAVNNRYLDLNVKLPRVYGFAEDAVKALVKANVNRGKLDMFITVNVTEDTSVKIALNSISIQSAKLIFIISKQINSSNCINFLKCINNRIAWAK